jgi:hypothetical protein
VPDTKVPNAKFVSAVNKLRNRYKLNLPLIVDTFASNKISLTLMCDAFSNENSYRHIKTLFGFK